MSNTAASVARQASLLMVASTVQKAISFFAFTLAARWLGAEQIGGYFYALSLSSLAGAWTDLGITPVAIRAFASSESQGWAVVRRGLWAKLFLIPLAIAAALLYGTALSTQREGFVPILVLALCVMAADALSLLGYGVLRGRQRLEKESLGLVIGQGLSGIGLVGFVWLGWGVVGAVGALLLASVWHVAWSAYWIRALGTQPFTEKISWRELAQQALPFALSGIFVRFYSSVDAMLLKRFFDEAVVGQYAVAYKLTYALQFLPMAFVAALYPALSAAYARRDEQALVHTALGSWRFMAMLGFPLAAGLSGFAPRLVPFLYGHAFAPSAQVLAVLAWVLPLIFLDFPLGSYLNATHRATQKTIAMGATMITNIALNLVLVPRFGAMGAAWAAVGCFVVLLGVGVYFAAPVFFSRTARHVAYRGALASLLIWLAIRVPLAHVPLLLGCALAPIVALAALVGTGLVEKQDGERLAAWIRQRV